MNNLTDSKSFRIKLLKYVKDHKHFVRFIILVYTQVIIGCGNKNTLPHFDSKQIELKPTRPDSSVDSLRSEVRALAEIVRRSNMIDIPETLRFCGERVPTERWWVKKELEEAFRFYTGFARNRKRIDIYLREARFYFPFIEKKLRDALIPSDLKYVPIAESEFNPQAQSTQKAVGIWQLMLSTGRERSMRINKYIDERKDFESATDAAIKKLNSDYVELGNWFLTLAAYNAGLNRVKQSLMDNADSSYFNLILPSETMDYCYRLIALKYILEHPQHYGFSEQIATERLIDIIPYVVKEKSTLPELAKIFKIPAREFQLLNPQYSSTTIPAGKYRLKIPQNPFAQVNGIDSNYNIHDKLDSSRNHR